jgi:enoyl-CoA hydratase/carnithine racemase
MNLNDIILKKNGPVATIILNRPESSNAFSVEMLISLETAINRIKEETNIRVVILTGAGKAFCAGGDVKEMAGGRVKGQAMKTFLKERVHRIPLLLESFDKPIIAAINGPAAGAGLDLALMCDLRLASHEARMMASFVKIGLVPGDGGAYFLPRLVGVGKALEYLMTGQTIDLNEALSLGLINGLTAPQDLMPTAESWALKLAALPPLAVQAAKRAVYQGLGSDLSQHLDYIAEKQAVLSQTSDHQRALQALLKKEKIEFKGE